MFLVFLLFCKPADEETDIDIVVGSKSDSGTTTASDMGTGRMTGMETGTRTGSRTGAEFTKHNAKLSRDSRTTITDPESEEYEIISLPSIKTVMNGKLFI